jgi:hypothetical protein
MSGKVAVVIKYISYSVKCPPPVTLDLHIDEYEEHLNLISVLGNKIFIEETWGRKEVIINSFKIFQFFLHR